MKHIFLLFFSLCTVAGFSQPMLKSVVYDFDGLDYGMTDLPDGDYRNGDLTYSVTGNPLGASEVLGDRVLECALAWSSGAGEFGKATNRFIELNAGADHLNFFIYNPTANNGSANLQVIITEDDNQNNIFEGNLDDKWISYQTIPESGGWQFVSIPLSSFQDGNTGGNGVFDAAYTGAQGMVFTVSFLFSKPVPTAGFDKYYLDMICFSEGTLPSGSSVFDLPYNPGYCVTGALSASAPDMVPAEIEGFFPTGKKIRYVNWFLDYASSGTTANAFPGAEVQNLMNGGYRPIITWEMMYSQYARLDPVQPRLDKINNGYFDGYIDAFADQVKTYSDTLILRIFHEFEGDWYPWSLTENNKDPQVYINAFRHVVNRFRARGANNVKWMWCINAEPKPYVAYNWVYSCYPGDTYVDIVATDIYNHPNTGVPPWKSFRYTAAEPYYYLHKYWPNKPLYICEVGCRERYNGEPGSSQTKGDWTCAMDRDLRSYFNKAQALIFFSMVKEHDWRINSSNVALQAFGTCVWTNSYYQSAVGVQEISQAQLHGVYPNPFTSAITLEPGLMGTEKYDLLLYDLAGKNILHQRSVDPSAKTTIGNDLPDGLYVMELRSETSSRKMKLVKLND